MSLVHQGHGGISRLAAKLTASYDQAGADSEASRLGLDIEQPQLGHRGPTGDRKTAPTASPSRSAIQHRSRRGSWLLAKSATDAGNHGLEGLVPAVFLGNRGPRAWI
jgi:hypothetical protein